MNRFRFRLQKVLDLRKAREKEAILELAGATQRLEREEAALRSLARWREAAWADLGSGLTKEEGCGPDALVLLRHIGSLEADIARAQERVRAAGEALEGARDALSARRALVKAIQSLRERLHEEWLIERRRLEGAQMDEVASVRHVRSRRVGGRP